MPELPTRELRLVIGGHDAKVLRALNRLAAAVVETVARPAHRAGVHERVPALPVAPGLEFFEHRTVFRAVIRLGRKAVRAPFRVDERTPVAALQPGEFLERNPITIPW